MALVVLLPLLLATVVVLLYKYGTRTHGTLEKLGIPVIKPYPFVGSIPRPWKIFGHKEDIRNAKRFGGIWGQYEGMTPQVFVSDVETVKRVLIKDFDHFTDRPNFFDFDVGRDMLDVLKGERWKLVRGVLSPALASGAKLKAMVPTMKECVDDAFTRMDAKLLKDPVLKIKDDVFGPLVLDIMAQFFFGMKVPDIGNTESLFVKNASMLGQVDTDDSATASLIRLFPSIDNYMLGKYLTSPFKYFLELLRRSVKQRRAEGIDRPDLVSTLMDAIDNKVPTKEFRDLKIDEDVLLAQGAALLINVYDTTGATLALVCYHLAKHPDIIDRIIDEVDAAGVEVTFDSLLQMPLLEAVVQETLRVSTLSSRHFRLCTRDWEYNGLRIPAGMEVVVPVWPLHMDPEMFPDPEKFLPDRWLGEQSRSLGQYNWMPFGLGPRACLGVRLATVQCKYVLATMLKRYRLSATEKTRLIPKKGAAVFSGFEPIYVKMEKLDMKS